MKARDLRRLFLTVTVSLACGKPVASVPAQREVNFAGTAAVRVSPARSGEWLLLFEALQPQCCSDFFHFFSPHRSGALACWAQAPKSSGHMVLRRAGS